MFFSVGRKVEELLFQLILQISRDKISEVGFFGNRIFEKVRWHLMVKMILAKINNSHVHCAGTFEKFNI